MFYLIRNGKLYYYLESGKEYTIGRMLCDIILQHDLSVSRKHVLIVQKGRDVYVEDYRSLTGTTIDGQKIKPLERTKFHVGSVMQIGAKTTFQLQEIKLAVTSMGLSDEEIENITEKLGHLDGVFRKKLDEDTTVLVTKKLKLTMKLILALVYGANIVTSDYFAVMSDAVQKSESPPDVMRFLPPKDNNFPVEVSDSLLESNQGRKVLFAHKLFVGEISPELSILITAAGGKVIISLTDETQVDDNCQIFHVKSSSGFKLHVSNVHGVIEIEENAVYLSVLYNSSRYLLHSSRYKVMLDSGDDEDTQQQPKRKRSESRDSGDLDPDESVVIKKTCSKINNQPIRGTRSSPLLIDNEFENSVNNNCNEDYNVTKSSGTKKISINDMISVKWTIGED